MHGYSREHEKNSDPSLIKVLKSMTKDNYRLSVSIALVTVSITHGKPITKV